MKKALWLLAAVTVMIGLLTACGDCSGEPDPEIERKPVIYLYPEQTTTVSVQLPTVDFTCAYPAYNDGWTVTAEPDGTLTDAAGQRYNYLFWEGTSPARWDMSKGFVVRGADTAAFLETELAALGLTAREANEFIVYWLPLMQDNPYNLITFQQQAYTDAVPLDITPRPDSMLRVFMVYRALNEPIDLPAPTLPTFERTGFTVVEWGGTQID